MLFYFFLYPCHNYIYEILLLHFTQVSARLHLVPFPNTLPAACSSCVLCYKYRMSFSWCLLTIVRNYCRSFSLGNKILCMLPYCIQVSSPDSVVAPATQGRPLDDRNLFHLCNQYLSASNENCYGIWNYPVSQTAAYTILLLSLEFHNFRLMRK